MKRLLLTICLYLLSTSLNAQNGNNYHIVEQFVYHQLEIIDAQTKQTIESFDDYKGGVASAIVGEQEYLIITMTEDMGFKLVIVNKAEEVFEGKWKIRMYQGGENVSGLGSYTANVFFNYNLQHNTKIPETIRFEMDGSPYIYELSGIIKIE